MMSLEQLQKEVMAEEAASSVSNMTDGVRNWLNLIIFIRLPLWPSSTTVESFWVPMLALPT